MENSLIQIIYALPNERDKIKRELLLTILEMMIVMKDYHDGSACEMPENCGHCRAMKRAIAAFNIAEHANE